MMMYLNAVREMNQRAIQISQTVQPYRERQRQYYREGKYREAVELCYDVRQQYVYYVHDNKAISDMEIVAGDCALMIGAYESAIDWFQTAKGAGEIRRRPCRSICPRRACPNGWQAGREAGSTEAALRRWGEGQAAWRQSVLFCTASSWGSASFQIREPEHDFL